MLRRRVRARLRPRVPPAFLGALATALVAVELRASARFAFLVQAIVIVARSPAEIAEARDDWVQGRRFGDVKRHAGPRLDAPPLHRLARANPIS